MEVRREVALPVSLETARQHLTKAFAGPMVVQQGNLILARIVCSGRIEENRFWIQYIEYGRYTTYLDLTGYLEETPGGVGLHMTFSSDESYHFLLYLPLTGVLLSLVSSSIKHGFEAELLVNYFFPLLFSGIISYLMRLLLSSFTEMRFTKLEGVLVGIITGLGYKGR